MSTVCYCGRAECAATDFVVNHCFADALKRLDASRAEVAMLREALEGIRGLNCELHAPNDCAEDCIGAASENIANAALSSTSDSWLKEHDRALVEKTLAAVEEYRETFTDEQAREILIKEVLGE